MNQDVPAALKWTLVGKISGIQLLIPQAGEKKTGTLQWGWTVEPVAIRVPDRTFALADADRPLGGVFAGEDRMEEIKAGFYTIKSVAADAAPEKVVEAFVTAIKEKNYPLYLECIEPGRPTKHVWPPPTTQGRRHK